MNMAYVSDSGQSVLSDRGSVGRETVSTRVADSPRLPVARPWPQEFHSGMEPKPLSRSVEDYLKAIYTRSESGAYASTTEIAEALEVQPGSATGMIKRLAEAELAEHVPYHGVRLTPAGKRAALRILRRHRILETYLQERLGYAWDHVHDEAEQLEHAASDYLIERMAVALENPSYDPHGSPIPSPTGEIEVVDRRTLAEASPGEVLSVRAVRDDDPEILQEMANLGLVPGARLRVLTVNQGKPMTVSRPDSGDEPRRVRVELAARIYVTAGGG